MRIPFWFEMFKNWISDKKICKCVKCKKIGQNRLSIFYNGNTVNICKNCYANFRTEKQCDLNRFVTGLKQ